jgi:actin-related protein
MAIKLRLLRSDNPDLIRAMQIVQTALDEVPAATVETTPHVNANYTIASTDTVVFADPGNGIITLSLPAVGTHAVAVRNIAQNGTVVVKVVDGSKINTSVASVSIGGKDSLTFAYNGSVKSWFDL